MPLSGKRQGPKRSSDFQILPISNFPRQSYVLVWNESYAGPWSHVDPWKPSRAPTISTTPTSPNVFSSLIPRTPYYDLDSTLQNPPCPFESASYALLFFCSSGFLSPVPTKPLPVLPHFPLYAVILFFRDPRPPIKRLPLTFPFSFLSWTEFASTPGWLVREFNITNMVSVPILYPDPLTRTVKDPLSRLLKFLPLLLMLRRNRIH